MGIAWWCTVFFALLPGTVLLAAICVLLLMLAPLFEIINFVRGKRTSQWAVADLERAQPICQVSTPHTIDVTIAAPSGAEVWHVHYFKPNALSRGKENMVFIHGVASGGAGYPPEMLAQLSNRYNVYSITLPGAGQPATPRSLQCATAEEAFNMYTQAIEQFLLVRGLRGAVVVAHSFGAFLSVRTALRFPTLIGKLVLVSVPGLMPWLGAKGSMWALYFHLRPVQRLLWTSVARWVVKALLDLASASAITRYWLGIFMVPSAMLDRLVSRCIYFNYFSGSSHWRWPLLPTILKGGLQTKIALMTGEFDSITPVSQCALVGNLLQVPFYQILGASHSHWHQGFLGLLDEAIKNAAAPRPVPDVAKIEAVMRRGMYASTFDVKATASRIAGLEEDIRQIAPPPTEPPPSPSAGPPPPLGR